MLQLSFPFPRDELSLHTYLEKAVQKSISLVITDNRTSMLSFILKGDTVFLRLHNMFLDADDRVLNEIAHYIRDSRKKTPLIRQYINSNSVKMKKIKPCITKSRPSGKHHDLNVLFDSINHEYFQGRVKASITWGSRGPRRAAKNRTLGSFTSDDNCIKINPILDNKKVPRYFLEFLIYHEMLHADIGIENVNGRRSLHSGEFEKREKIFRHYDRAIAWEKRRW